MILRLGDGRDRQTGEAEPPHILRKPHELCADKNRHAIDHKNQPCFLCHGSGILSVAISYQSSQWDWQGEIKDRSVVPLSVGAKSVTSLSGIVG